ncbi:hypothetical protein C8039_04590 [Halogeometricum sp. wsp3]|nr:hypothetical protein C8039_04590 [Halogeometricum sp. wsp3]
MGLGATAGAPGERCRIHEDEEELELDNRSVSSLNCSAATTTGLLTSANRLLFGTAAGLGAVSTR